VHFRFLQKRCKHELFFDSINMYVFSKDKTICIISVNTIFAVFTILDAIKNSD
jgi:hypothetical protein